jgi:adenylate cyclase class IV
MIEVEERGLLTEEKYNELLAFLDKHAESLGEDDKDVVYYIYDDKLLKVVNNISKKNAKVSLKMNKLGDGVATLENEVTFSADDFSKMKDILDTIANPNQIIEGRQKRKNYKYKECEIAVKWSKDYKYHFEIEKILESEVGVNSAENELDVLVEELGLVSMKNDELKQFQQKVQDNAKNNYN